MIDHDQLLEDYDAAVSAAHERPLSRRLQRRMQALAAAVLVYWVHHLHDHLHITKEANVKEGELVG